MEQVQAAAQEQDAEKKRLAELRDRLDGQVGPVCGARVAESSREDFSEVFQLFLRMVLWVRTMSKLEFKEDFQAFASGSRAIFELAVDLVLLEKDPTASTKMKAFELRLKWKQAKKAHAFITEKVAAGVPMAQLGLHPDTLRVHQEFIDHHASQVESDKKRFWPTTTNVRRWTGQDLGTDARTVDALGSGLRFSEFYATGYSYQCWNIHGSTLTGMRDFAPDHLFMGSSLALLNAWVFAAIATIATVRKLGLAKDVVVMSALGRGYDTVYPSGSVLS